VKKLFSSVVFVSLFSFSALALEPVDLSEDQFRMYQHYKMAMADARVQAMKPAARLGAIAKDGKFKPKDLQAAVTKGEAAGDIKAKCEANLKEVLAGTTLKLGKLEVDTSAAQAVTYVQWFNEEQKDLVTEASLAAAKAAEACPLSSTITVYAQDKAAPTMRVFQALITSSSAKRIQVDKVKDYAETRYVKLFEKMKNAARGDDLSAENAAAATTAVGK
jgi:hypothetical protein